MTSQKIYLFVSEMPLQTFSLGKKGRKIVSKLLSRALLWLTCTVLFCFYSGNPPTIFLSFFWFLNSFPFWQNSLLRSHKPIHIWTTSALFIQFHLEHLCSHPKHIWISLAITDSQWQPCTS